MGIRANAQATSSLIIGLAIVAVIANLAVAALLGLAGGAIGGVIGKRRA